MIRHFISDIHLSAENPSITQLFLHYLQNHIHLIDELYILGDLFNVWIGDDDDSEWLQPITQQIQTVTSKQIPIYFCHGNRDFLLGTHYAEIIGMQLLPEYFVQTCQSSSILLCHGDSFCTHDKAYMDFRHQVRSADWKNAFLSLSLEERRVQAESYRQQSQTASKEKQEDILDVNLHEIDKAFETFNTQIIIHGHTHRPAKHQHNHHCVRWVLSDWHSKGNFLELKDTDFTMFYFDLHHKTIDNQIV